MIYCKANANELVPASVLFSNQTQPADLPQEAIGDYVNGCLAGGVYLPKSGAGFQTMRPSRNRSWAHPVLKSFIEDLGSKVTKSGFPALLIGDISQPRGGPMDGGHLSHQTGLDVDIWFKPSPKQELNLNDREFLSAETVVGSFESPWVNENFTEREAWLLEAVAKDDRVSRIFVAPPIKKVLCEQTKVENRSWLTKIRPWFGHTYHFHVRLACPSNSQDCVNQKDPPTGDGCGSELDTWLQPAELAKKRLAQKPRTKDKTLSDLPLACRNVLGAKSQKK